jgi:predicted ATPase
MAVLRTGLKRAMSGHGQLVLLVGEPGIGKTRTAHELALYAQQQEAQVFFGRCYEGEGAPPFWPWVQIVRACVAKQAPHLLKAEIGAGAADIAQAIPEVREQLPDLPPALHANRSKRASVFSIASQRGSKLPDGDSRWCSSWTTCKAPTSRPCCCSSSWPGS